MDRDTDEDIFKEIDFSFSDESIVSLNKEEQLITFKGTGKIKIKKNTRRGTYKMDVTVNAAGNTKYLAATKRCV